jgi:N-acetylneuraminic acid mutarotase
MLLWKPLRALVPLCALLCFSLSISYAQIVLNFGSSTLQNLTLDAPTSLQFGPDGRLYVAQVDGMIYALTIERRAANDYHVTAQEAIDLIQRIPNHNDDGTPYTQGAQQRQVTGLVVAGTAARPLLFVSSSDYRVAYDFLADEPTKQANVDTNSSMITRLTWDGSAWQQLDLVRGLPRGINNHSINGMAYDAAAHVLYVAQGGLTNMGAPIQYVDAVPEYAYSAAILRVDVTAIGEQTYDLPTLDDPDRDGTADANDPFGGNNGQNQARLTADGPVQLYAVGYRNAYDVVLSESGRLYATNNGPNANWGGLPIDCGIAINDAVLPTDQASLHLVTAGQYAGHPNPTRGNAANTFADQSPIVAADPRECDYIPPRETAALAVWSNALQGLTEYRASNFGGALRGDLLVAGWQSGTIERFQLNGAGTAVLERTALFGNFGVFPLDVTAQGDADSFGGTVWAALFLGDSIQVFEPSDYEGAQAPSIVSLSEVNDAEVSSVWLDTDGDGYSNADELENGSSTTIVGSIPPDFDGDLLSDMRDDDDDGDGVPDAADVFAYDASNGQSTTLPLRYTWENGAPATGLLGLGFTGVMSNGIVDPRFVYTPQTITPGGAQGKVTLQTVTEGTTLANTQMNGLQFGVPVRAPLLVHTRILPPFLQTTKPPNADQRVELSQGVYVGLGDQDNYVRVALSIDGVQVLSEDNSVVSAQQAPVAQATTLAYLDLYLYLDPQQGIQAAYALPDGPITLVGARARPSWLPNLAVAAVGISATTVAGQPYAATWDFIEVLPNVAPPADAVTAAAAALPLLQAECGLRRAAPLPRAAFESGSAVHDGQLYIALGTYDLQLLATTDFYRYDPPSDQWTQLAPYPIAATHRLLVLDADGANGARLWSAGGFGGNHPGTPVADVYYYDIAANTWHAAPSLPLPVAGGGLVKLGRTLHYFGGLLNGDGGNPHHWTLDLDNPTAWRDNAAPLLPAPNHFGALAVDGKILLVGGQYRHDTNNEELLTTYLYDPQTDTWTQLADLPYPLSHTENAILQRGDEVWVYGGRSLAIFKEGVRDIFVYNLRSNTWRIDGQLPEPRLGTTVAEIDGELIITGGGVAWYDLRDTTWRGTLNGTCTPISGLTAASTVPTFVGTPTLFSAAISDGTGVAYAWAFGDGSPVMLTYVPTVTHTYSEPNTYLVNVTAINALGHQTAQLSARVVGPPDGAAEALIVIDPQGDIHSSVAAWNSFSIRNVGDVPIVQVQYDLNSALLTDAAFDAGGTEGDTFGIPLSVGMDQQTGLIETQVTQKVLTLRFNNFTADKELRFAVDIDPTSLRGLDPVLPYEVASNNGLELIGTRVTVTFADGTQRVTQLYHVPNSVSGAQNITDVSNIAPTLELLGYGGVQISADGPQQTLRVRGTQGGIVQVFIADAQMVVVAPQTPFSFNRFERYRELTARIGAGGFVDLPISIAAQGVTLATATYRQANGGTSAQATPLLMRVGP